uniref:Ribosomal protein S8 n=1 Tax=Chromera velia TaxID=505693 RepID=D9IXF4_9ALVE|nr:ribosomal protein S8 [Chromera velia]ADJ66562.1 ribosomal protein S8 [Chromera velia]
MELSMFFPRISSLFYRKNPIFKKFLSKKRKFVRSRRKRFYFGAGGTPKTLYRHPCLQLNTSLSRKSSRWYLRSFQPFSARRVRSLTSAGEGFVLAYPLWAYQIAYRFLNRKYMTEFSYLTQAMFWALQNRTYHKRNSKKNLKIQKRCITVKDSPFWLPVLLPFARYSFPSYFFTQYKVKATKKTTGDLSSVAFRNFSLARKLREASLWPPKSPPLSGKKKQYLDKQQMLEEPEEIHTLITTKVRQQNPLIKDSLANFCTLFRNSLINHQRFCFLPATYKTYQWLKILKQWPFMREITWFTGEHKSFIVIEFDARFSLKTLSHIKIKQLSTITKHPHVRARQLHTLNRKFPFGLVILSSSKGLIHWQHAQTINMGGELLFTIF